jgi:acetate---CoA ligase (ADP-forming)
MPLDPFFSPRSIAVIGASRSPGTIGWQIIDNLLRHGFQGTLYPVNPAARAIHSVPAYPSVSAIPGEVDLAVVVVPKQHVEAVVEECGQKGVRAVVVISAGFREVGGSGIERERRLVELVRSHGMRLVGPNCMGVLNAASEVSMNATFAPTMPPHGAVSFMSQSGAMGVTILDYAAEYGIGINHFVSVGNKPDVSGNDLIEFWASDAGTRVILMYLENFGNPRRFTKIARSVTRVKPIIVVKSGRSTAGALAASSHTGALAGLDIATDALLEQCGVIRVDTVEELFDLAMAFGELPIPRGNSVAIITNAGGPGIIIADACEAGGLAVRELSPETQAKLRSVFPEEASVRNPVDMIASATPEGYRVALEAALDDPNVDAAIAAFVPPLGLRQEDVARAIVQVVQQQRGKPVLAVLMGRAGLPQGRAQLKEAGVPAYIFPESAARALAAMYRHRRWLERAPGAIREFAVDDDAVASIIAGALAAEREHLTTEEALGILRAYGIPTAGSRVAANADEAAAAAAEVGLPAVLKVLSPDIVHKTDIGGVALDLRSAADVRAAYEAMMDRIRSVQPDARIEGVLVQRFVRGGRETIIGVSQDPAFGPLLMFGLGGIHVEALKDVAFRIHPVSDVDADEMIHSIRGFQLLEGMRGERPADLRALREAVERISQLVGRHPAIAELDINPLLALERGTLALDARVRVARES